MKKESSMREMNNPHFFVRVASTTYNQASYIVDAMNGFTMQKTTFPFVCTIIDDASTDGEQEVIKHYLEDFFDFEDKTIARNEETEDYRLLFARHKTNLNCYFAVMLLKYNHYSIGKLKPMVEDFVDTKYVAICEGDDYWIEPEKLQKQVQFMENNPDVSIYTHNALVKYPDGREKPFNSKKKDSYYGLLQCIYMRWFTPTASFLFRGNVKRSPIWAKYSCNGDMITLLSCLLCGKMYYSGKKMSVYNYCTPNSLSRNTNKQSLYRKKINLYKALNEASNKKYSLAIFPLILYYTIKKIAITKKKYLYER